MRKIFISMLLLVGVITMQAQTENDEMSREIERTIELSNTTNTFMETMRLQMQPLVAQGMIKADKLQSVTNELAKLLMPALKQRLAVVYRENFTLDELKQMNAYLSSSVGQKAVKLTPVLASAGAEVVQSPEMRAKMQELLGRLVQH